MDVLVFVLAVSNTSVKSNSQEANVLVWHDVVTEGWDEAPAGTSYIVCTGTSMRKLDVKECRSTD